MKTAVRDTSIAAYRTDVRPTLSERQKTVYELLEHEINLTNSEIAARLDWPINCVTPRVYELRDMGLVIEDGKRHCRVTGRTAYAWRANNGMLFSF